MFQIESMLAQESPYVDECIERVLAETRGENRISYGTNPNLPLILVQAAVPADPCDKPLQACGNCHLPRRNNCEYRVEYTVANREMKAFGRLEKADASSITLSRNCEECSREVPSRAETGRVESRIIPRADIVRTVWLNGGDLPETWWDFKSFSARGTVAKRMLAISAENNVACTNCHVKHGDFRLTSEGETFGNTGKIVRRVPLR